MNREDIIHEARDWLGTPYRSRHYPVKGEACDCASFLLGLLLALGQVPPGTKLPAYSPSRHLHRSDEAYRHELLAHGFQEIPKAEAGLGSVILMVVGERQPASHAAVVTAVEARPTEVVHAHQPSGRVIASRLDWKLWSRTRFAFEFPGLATWR